MDTIKEPVTGAEIKLNINIEPVEGYHMEDYLFTAEVYTRPDVKIAIVKDQMQKIDADHYVAGVDSSKLGPGQLKVDITAYIPDDYFPDSTRTEKAKEVTNIIVCR